MYYERPPGLVGAKNVLIEPEITGASIVLIGNFNPAILSPDWFIRHEIVSEASVDRSDPDAIVHAQVSQFKLDWCQVIVEPTKFSISTSKDPFVSIADLTVKTFGEFLPHTPIRSLGMNRNVHFRVASLKVRDKVGFRLAPPEAWGDWSAEITAKSGKTRGGLGSLTMIQRVFGQERTGHVAAKVEPSAQLPSGLGIYMRINDHYDFADSESSEGAQPAMKLLEEHFEKSLYNSDKIIDQVMALANAAAQQD